VYKDEQGIESMSMILEKVEEKERTTELMYPNLALRDKHAQKELKISDIKILKNQTKSSDMNPKSYSP
jgi:hypothetical protein